MFLSILAFVNLLGLTVDIEIKRDEPATVKKLYVREGDHVFKDQLLFIVDDTKEKAAIIRAREMIRDAKEELAECFLLAMRDNAMQDNAMQDKVIQTEKLTQAEKKLASAFVELEDAKAAFTRTRESAPATSIVIKSDLKRGALITQESSFILRYAELQDDQDLH